MTSPAAKRAAELANAYMEKNPVDYASDRSVLHDYIQHVSDVAERLEPILDKIPLSGENDAARELLRAFILPKPVDLIAELFREAFADSNIGEFDGYWKVMAKFKELAAERGLTITPIV